MVIRKTIKFTKICKVWYTILVTSNTCLLTCTEQSTQYSSEVTDISICSLQIYQLFPIIFFGNVFWYVICMVCYIIHALNFILLCIGKLKNFTLGTLIY